MNRNTRWLDTAYELTLTGSSRQALREIFRGVEWMFANRELQELDDTLANVDVSRLDCLNLVGLIRVTYRARAALPHWTPLLDSIKTELKRQQVPDIRRLLVGLE